MDSIFSFINVTTESQEEYEDNYMPTLDFKIRMKKDENIITYQFFKKKMANQNCINKMSAISDKSKQSILS